MSTDNWDWDDAAVQIINAELAASDITEDGDEVVAISPGDILLPPSDDDPAVVPVPRPSLTAAEVISVAGQLVEESAFVFSEVAEQLVDRFTVAAGSRRLGYIMAIRALVAIRRGAYVAIAHALMRAHEELGVQPEDLILDAFGDDVGTLGAAKATISNMRALATVIIPKMRERGLSSKEIVEVLSRPGAISKAHRFVPAIRAAESNGTDEDVEEVVAKAVETIEDERATAEDAAAKAMQIKRSVLGIKPHGYYVEIRLPNNQIMYLSVADEDTARRVGRALAKKMERVDWTPLDIVKYLVDTFGLDI